MRGNFNQRGGGGGGQNMFMRGQGPRGQDGRGSELFPKSG